MKVMMLVDLYPPTIGGAERHVQSLSVKLSQMGHPVSVCTLDHHDSVEYDQGVKIYRLKGLFYEVPFLYRGAKKKWHPPTGDWLLTRKLARIIRHEKPDIIHAHGWILYSVLLLRKKSNIPLIATAHTYGYFCPRSTLLRKDAICEGPAITKCLGCIASDYGIVRSLAAYYGVKSNRSRLKYLDKLIAVSPFVKEAHAGHLGLEDDDVPIIPNFYAPERDGAAKKAKNLPQDFILFVGTLAPHKGVEVLIEAYRRLYTRTTLLLIGYSHRDYHYKSEGNMLVMENAPRDVVIQAMSNCRFLIVPSIWPDPAPTVAYEAMSHRKAIIAANVGGLRDIVVDGETGILVPANDPDKLVQAIGCLLESPEMASEMGQKGYQRFWLCPITGGNSIWPYPIPFCHLSQPV